MLTSHEIEERVSYHPPTEESIKRHQIIRKQIADTLTVLRDILPTCRESNVAITKTEEVMFWANAAIARNQDSLPVIKRYAQPKE